MNHTARTRPVLGLVLAAALLALTACGGSDSDADKKSASDEPTSQESSTDEPAAGAPDLDGIPDVVAEVNGEDITKDEFATLYTAQFQQAEQQAQMSGQEPDEKALQEQTVNNLVDTELLAQDAESRGIEVTDDDVDAELDVLAKQYDMGSAEEFLAAVAEQGTSEDEALDQVRRQVMVELVVTDEEGSLEPTEKELRKIYAQAKSQQKQIEKDSEEGKEGPPPQKIPPFDEIKDQLAEKTKTDRVNEGAQKLVEKLRKDADITINL